jgi:valyl-tRNA synthetase
VIVEPRLTAQWYVKMDQMAKGAIDAVTSGSIQFYPKNAENTYFEWLNNIQDWCISRQLWWGHRIPAYYDESGKIYVGTSEADVRTRYSLPNFLPLKQDEDVLDTWFSSALWPFSTLGWPEKTADLETFYPTSVLVTGFDLIFFWIARMIMFGLKFTGKVPFRQVYFHGIIRDHEGKKMSKSKGNVLDPVDLIDGIDLESLLQKRTFGMMQPRLKESIIKATKSQFPQGIPAYGCDALRFTFTALASTSRDINFDMNRMEGYRNFCNKIWNAARFVLMNVDPEGGQAYQPSSPRMLSRIDRWIWDRLNAMIPLCHQAIAEYRFDQLAQALYEFIWNDYCDWYLELAKVVLNDPTRTEEEKNGTKYTLVNVLETALRLAHPVIPFITEEIFKSLQPFLSEPQSTAPTLMLCPYPIAQNSGESFDLGPVQKLIVGIRTLRSESQISPAKKIKVVAECLTPTAAQWVQDYQPWIENLCRLESLTLSHSASDIPAQALTALMDSVKIHIPTEGLIDREAEQARLSKLEEKLMGDIARTEAMLNNERFRQSAPPAVIEKEENRLKESNAHLAEVRLKRDKLG